MRWYILLMAGFFALWQNAYFGGNFFPRSDAELIADGISILITAVACLAFVLERSANRSSI